MTRKAVPISSLPLLVYKMFNKQLNQIFFSKGESNLVYLKLKYMQNVLFFSGKITKFFYEKVSFSPRFSFTLFIHWDPVMGIEEPFRAEVPFLISDTPLICLATSISSSLNLDAWWLRNILRKKLKITFLTLFKSCKFKRL